MAARFAYADSGTHATLTRDEAIDRLRNGAGNINVIHYPGAVVVQGQRRARAARRP